MSKRVVEITQTYCPAPDRIVIVDGIPAIELRLGDESETVLEMAVSERLQSLVKRALRSNKESVQRLTYSAGRSAHSVSSGERVR
jgi:hypothetical protein